MGLAVSKPKLYPQYETHQELLQEVRKRKYVKGANTQNLVVWSFTTFSVLASCYILYTRVWQKHLRAEKKYFKENGILQEELKYIPLEERYFVPRYVKYLINTKE